jgi:RimJ/RimL family protein N-acetyltransferase
MVRKATQQDFEFIYDLYMHPQVNPFLLYEMMDADEFKPIFDELLNKDVKYIYESGGIPVGMFKLVPNVYRSGHIVYLGGLAIHSSFAGKGYGLSMMQEIIHYAEAQGFLRIELSVSITNERAKHLYEKAGFEKEGILRKYTYLKTEDSFFDEVLMSWLSERIK